jgi:hypothetical protein
MIHDTPTKRHATSDAPGQPGFGQLLADQGKPVIPLASHRTAEHRAALAVADRAAVSESPAKQAAIDKLAADLREFIRRHGVGRTFHSVDFCTWLHNTGRWPKSLDMRCLGGLINRQARDGVIQSIGVAPNGGAAARNYHSTKRDVWRIVRLPGGARQS